MHDWLTGKSFDFPNEAFKISQLNQAVWQLKAVKLEQKKILDNTLELMTGKLTYDR